MPAYPWDRQPKESEEAYSAFLTYRDLGEGRTVPEAYRQAKRKPDARQPNGTWNKWAASRDWATRAQAYDDHLRSERDKVAAAEARKWERRRQQHLESAWDDAQKLRAKAGRMLDFPIARVEVVPGKDGKPDNHVHPAKWTFQTAAQILKFAVEMEAAVLTAAGKDPAELTDAEARAIAEEPESGGTEAAGRGPGE